MASVHPDRPSPGPPFPGPTKISLFFFASSLLSEGLLVEFWCFCHVRPRRLWGRRGFSRQPENSKRAHLSAPALQTPPKFHEKTHRREKNEFCGGRGKKKRAPPTLRTPPFGPPPFGPLLFLGLAPGTPFHEKKRKEKTFFFFSFFFWEGEGGRHE